MRHPREWNRLQWVFAVLAAFGVLLLGIAASLTANQCQSGCDEDIQGAGWFETPGSWEKWVQLGAAFLVAAPLVWAAAAAFRGDGRLAGQRAFVAVMPLVIWIVLIGNA